MRILKVSAKNFQSYESLYLDLTKLGLTGVFGTTGAGKSTLMDVIPWVLFGTTGKGTAADDVRPWGCQEPTVVLALVDTPQGQISVCRVRAPIKNDLHFAEVRDSVVGPSVRGKDLKDTQKLLETRLGVTTDLFMMSGYMSQFSEADSFFIASAKDRRATLEKIADQEFAIKLGERAADARKTTKAVKDNLDLQLSKVTGSLGALEQVAVQTTLNIVEWNTKQERKIEETLVKFETYEPVMAKAVADWDAASIAKLDRLDAQIQALPETEEPSTLDARIAELRNAARCHTCNALSDKNNEAIAKLREQKLKNSQVKDTLDRLYREYQVEGAKENPYTGAKNPYESQLLELKSQKNPFIGCGEEYVRQITHYKSQLAALQADLAGAEARIASLTWLYDKSFELRGLMMDRVVRQVEEKTNYYLEKFFDGALRVTLRCADSDKIDVTILNDGNEAPFKSLSGGERCMLKLAFSLSLMRAAQNKAGVSLNCVMLDEPLNGLPEDLKVKAFGLFEELAAEIESVLVIDHSTAFQNCFHNTFTIDKSSGKSLLLISA